MVITPRPLALAAGLLLALAACDRSPSGSSASAEDAWVKLSPSAASVESLLAGEAAKAKAKSLLPVAYLGAPWCGPCQAIKKSRSDPRMADAFAGTRVVELNIDEWKDTDLKALGFETGTIPVFFQLDDRGHANGRTINGGAWGPDVPENMAPALKTFFKH
jgi:thiol-disulfide isomerase/thioredoxin